jgi:tripartite-type tricarboxylate transporter receptor subunit TctC
MHVPYRGGAQAVTDVIGGQVPLLAMNALEVKPQVASGKLKVLAVLSPQRSAIFPDAPTIAESGFKGFEASVWYALMAPAKTPAAVVDRLHAEVQKALQTTEVQRTHDGGRRRSAARHPRFHGVAVEFGAPALRKAGARRQHQTRLTTMA